MTGARTLAVSALVVAATALLSQAAAAPEVGGLGAGRAVWLGSCQVCHAEPDSGAPQLGDAPAWEARAGKGREALYARALNGFVGPAGDEMPARGGNPALSDDDVRAAVDYMLAASGR